MVSYYLSKENFLRTIEIGMMTLIIFRLRQLFVPDGLMLWLLLFMQKMLL